MSWRPLGRCAPWERIPGISQCLTIALCHYTTVSSWYTNWRCWRNLLCITWGRYGDAALLFNGRMGRKTRGSRNCKSITLIFAIQFSHPHGTCHACHTLDTPLMLLSTLITSTTAQLFCLKTNVDSYSARWWYKNYRHYNRKTWYHCQRQMLTSPLFTKCLRMRLLLK